MTPVQPQQRGRIDNKIRRKRVTQSISRKAPASPGLLKTELNDTALHFTALHGTALHFPALCYTIFSQPDDLVKTGIVDEGQGGHI